MCKPFHPGNAAQNGLLAALLASKNFTSSDQGIEAKRGFANVLVDQRSTRRDHREARQDLRDRRSIPTSRSPAASSIHPAIDGCIQLRNEHKLKAADIESIALGVHPLVLELTGKKTPQTGLEGKFSVYHSSAVAIIYGAAGEEEYSDEVVRDPQVIALRDRVIGGGRARHS